MSETFNSIRDELNKLCDQIVNKHLGGKQYNQKDGQMWINTISDEIIKSLQNQQKGIKFICIGTIFQKGDASLHFSSTCLWDPNKDGSLTFKWENEHMHCFICLFGVL
jgi:hypothetical protein